MKTKLKTMQNVTFDEIEGMVNGLIQQPVGDDAAEVIVRVIQVQVIPYFVLAVDGYSYDVVVLVEVGPAEVESDLEMMAITSPTFYPVRPVQVWETGLRYDLEKWALGEG